MKTVYEPQSIEQSLYERWEANAYFKAQEDETLEPYCIMLPPPNVTGNLHMGHAFQQAIMDALVRYQRMCGKSCLWQVGTDHAGIATQMVVERKLAREEGKSRHDIGRDAFIKKIWAWKKTSGTHITAQMRRLGNSVDWSCERFTMDEHYSQSVREVFVRLYNDGLIYRSKRLVNWDPKFQTAISDLEVEAREQKGSLWYLRYPLVAKDGQTTNDCLVVATTRPETLLGDLALAVHPEDERYKKWIGKSVLLPVLNRKIPIIGDDYVDPTFGTGCVKITPAHDFNDALIGKRHKLGYINLFTPKACLLPEIVQYDSCDKKVACFSLPKAYQGLERFAARACIVEDLQKLGVIEKVEQHVHKVPYGDRSGEVIEPYLTDQWFVKTRPLAEPAVQAVQTGKVRFVSKQYENMFFSWMGNIEDWCISRQLWWGHRIPAFYDEKGQFYVGESEEAVRKTQNLESNIVLKQDEDVLDTWFSSALWTFVTLGWPAKTKRLKKYHPTSVLVTGFDIIFFWVARMIMMSLYLVKDEEGRPEIPFKDIYITGLILDEKSQKMSKTKGNILDPLDMIDGIGIDALIQKRAENMMQPQLAQKIIKRTRKEFAQGIQAHGTDALRFTLYMLASTGRSINWDLKRLEGNRNFCNKIWNAARYVWLNTQNYKADDSHASGDTLADRWLKTRLQKTIKAIHQGFQDYRLDHASHAFYDFFWNDFCDWYLELSKHLLQAEEQTAQKHAIQKNMLEILETSMRLLHPFMPFISETIWKQFSKHTALQKDTIMLQPYPKFEPDAVDEEAEEEITWLKGIILGVRQIRGEAGLSAGKTLTVLLKNLLEQDYIYLQRNRNSIKKIANLDAISVLEKDEVSALCAKALSKNVEIFIPMQGLIDKGAELKRINRALEKLRKNIERMTAKMQNLHFVENAPPAVVEKEKQKHALAKEQYQKLNEQKKEVEAL